MRTARLIICSALAYLALATTAHAQSTAPKPMTTKHLLIIGASYAGEWGQPDLPGYRITNKGVGGEESWQVAARFEKDAIAAKPDVILIWGHINDISRSSPDKYEATKQRAIQSYQQMLAQAKAAQIPVILATEITRTTAIGWQDWIPAAVAWVRGKESYSSRINRQVKAINDWLRQTAAQEKIPLLDLEKAVDDGNGGRKSEFTKEDGSHVTPAGYAAITQYVRTQLKP
jgi:lysophospholipase L1-like esterase